MVRPATVTARADEKRRLELLASIGGSLKRRYPAPFLPSVKQEAFIRMPQLEVFFGGSAGPGKSTGLLMAALEYAHAPDYAALLLRRTYPQLTMPGGLIPMSKEWLGGTDASWSEKHTAWTFPAGATLTFGHIQYEADVYRYLGSEYQFVGFDELTGFSESMYTYLFSRLRRSTDNPVPLRMRGASNPGGIGHDWVKRRFVSPATREPGVGFVKALMSDNPGLDVSSYRAGLAKLHPIDRMRLEHGDWDVMGVGGLFRRESLMEALVPANYPEGSDPVRAWDLAATAPSTANPDPDYTVGMLADMHEGKLVIRDVVRDQLDPDGVERLMTMTALADGPEVLQRVEQEPGASGKAMAASVVRLLARYPVETIRPTGDKATRARPFAAMLGNGLVRIVEGPWTMALVDELTQFDQGSHDDQVDTCSSCHEYLTAGGGEATLLVPAADLRMD